MRKENVLFIFRSCGRLSGTERALLKFSGFLMGAIGIIIIGIKWAPLSHFSIEQNGLFG